jgi:hemoglobin/transferrin/lactoferrin receptor protein
MRLFWAGILLCGSAWAQETAPPGGQEPKKQEEIKEIKIYGISPLKPLGDFESPQSVDVVTSSDIDGRRLSRTTPEALKETPGVSVQKTGPAQGSPFIRGFTGFRNVMLVDGVRLNNSIFREGPNQYWATVDSFMVDRLEVVRGPSSVLYGSDSIGGTVLAFTKEPPSFEPGVSVHERTFYRYASAEDSHSVRQEVWGNADDLGWMLGGTHRDFNDIVGGRHTGTMEGTGYDEYDADLKLVYRIGKESKLTLAAQHHRMDDASRWHSTMYSQEFHGTALGTDRVRDFDQERNLYYLQYHLQSEGGIIDALKAGVSWHVMAEKETRIRSSGAKNIREFEVDTPGVQLQAGKQTAIGYFTAGGEFYRDRVNSSGYDRSAAGVLTEYARGSVADDATYDLWGIFLQDEFSVGGLDVIPGIRFSRASVTSDKVDPGPGDTVIPDSIDEDYQAVTGSLRLLYRVTENWNVIAGWGMGFRAPSLDDSTAINFVLSGSLDLPAEDLDPEVTHTFDLGLRARYRDWEAGVFVFTTILDDFIQRAPAGDVNGDGVTDFTKMNSSEGYVYGVEAAALYRLTAEISLFGDLGYAKGEVDQLVGADWSLQPLSKVGPGTIHLGARYEPKDTGVWVEGLFTAADHQKHLSVSDTADTQRIPVGGTPGYTAYTLRGGYRVNEHFTATVAVENITDRDYRQHGSGVNEPGTNLILATEIRF